MLHTKPPSIEVGDIVGGLDKHGWGDDKKGTTSHGSFVTNIVGEIVGDNVGVRVGVISTNGGSSVFMIFNDPSYSNGYVGNIRSVYTII